MDKDEALQMCLEYIETDAHERKYVRHAIKAALAQPAQEPVAKAWNDGYKAGVADERTSEANIGIAGFGAKIKPARQNPYGVAQPAQEPVALVIDGVLVKSELPKKYTGHLYTTPPKREWTGLTDEEQMALLKDSDGKTRHWLVWQVEAKLREKST